MAPPRAIGLNLAFLLERSGGSGTYAYGLIEGLRTVSPATRLVAFTGDRIPERMAAAPWADEVRWVRMPMRRERHPRLGRALLLAHQWGSLPALALRHRVDVIHGLGNVIPPVAPRTATVVTILDVIWAHYPNSMEAAATRRMTRLAQVSARAADRVITISHAAARDISGVLDVPLERIDVTYLAADTRADVPPAPAEALRARLELGPGPVVLTVAQKREHKNLDGLIRAFAHVRPEAQLVLVGSPTPHEQELRALAGSLGLADRVHFPGWLSDAEVEGLYAAATCLVLPSWIEGFGLPVLEAMRRGLAVACSNATSLPEVAGDAALLFDPADEADMAAAITRLLDDADTRPRLIEAGHTQAARFTWEATATQTLEAYERALRPSRR